MKTIFLKNFLPTFAFILAIVASFAFKAPPENDMGDSITGYYQTLDEKGTIIACTPVEVDCNFTSCIICTVDIGATFPDIRQVYAKDSPPTSTNCYIILYKSHP